MNWLAHILLSRRDIDYQLGNLLADPLKGKPWQGASESIAAGMQMHRAIDRFTDTHSIFVCSKRRLGDRGYLKGVVIDLLYDHYLARNWQLYAADPLADFLECFHTSALQTSTVFPDRPKYIINRLASSNMLAGYADFTGFINALHRIDQRISPRLKQKDSALNYLTAVEREYDDLQADFERFFPELIAFFQNHELGSQQDHYFHRYT